ncbi:SAM-dependent methyltransferase [Thermasporomyces composti]|jgi:cyclopropane-fatty-acyl-phospholipid synthase|uniref:Cyclopropane-fatty-acyl-phospholipid synthase n=1 Tax=Thermasporomyces composti TaxID=696763 RepID=A0A3D9V2G0_THECX|nr:cyclopropane-fatty-acyl-phospholipid synthase family protein [Thermasporomyces composti]REF35679.1 cyclopropane-fatty-acyl-phospholipid synthase [Thermasporomyces composti]
MGEEIVVRHVVAERLHDVLLRLFGREAPVRIRAWDGSIAGPPDAPVVTVNSRRALRRLLWRPDELGLARAYVAGEVEVEGKLLDALERLAPFGRAIGRRPELTAADRGELLRTAALLGAVGPQPKPPAEEITGAERRHGLVRDKTLTAAPDSSLGPPLLARIYGSTMVHSTGYWTRPDASLDEAQHAGLEHACRKLGLSPGMRVLDVGCGWGSFLIHAAERYGVTGIGVTLSPHQAEIATKRAVEAGLSDQVEFRLADWRDVGDGPFDAIAGSGMAEYVGPARLAEYARTLYGLLRPGGRLLVHQVSARGERVVEERSFIDAYVFPGAELLTLGTIVDTFEGAGLEIRDLETFREHYARTLRAWIANLEDAWDACLSQTSPGRLRVWHLYLALAALAFELARITVYQLVAVRPHADGRADMPWARTE